MIPIETERARETHELSSTDGGVTQDIKRKQERRETHILWGIDGAISQDTRRKRDSEGYPRTVKRGGMEKVRTPRESEMARSTHFLSSEKGWTSQDVKRKERARVTHSLSSEEGGTSQDTKTKRER